MIWLTKCSLLIYIISLAHYYPIPLSRWLIWRLVDFPWYNKYYYFFYFSNHVKIDIHFICPTYKSNPCLIKMKEIKMFGKWNSNYPFMITYCVVQCHFWRKILPRKIVFKGIWCQSHFTVDPSLMRLYLIKNRCIEQRKSVVAT